MTASRSCARAAARPVDTPEAILAAPGRRVRGQVRRRRPRAQAARAAAARRDRAAAVPERLQAADAPDEPADDAARRAVADAHGGHRATRGRRRRGRRRGYLSLAASAGCWPTSEDEAAGVMPRCRRRSPRAARSSRTSAGRASASATTAASAWTGCATTGRRYLPPAMLEHVEMTLIASSIGFVIAFVRRAARAPRSAASSCRSPRLGALLHDPEHRVLPDHGADHRDRLGRRVEIALVCYTLLILFRNTLTGLREVPAEVHEAARGMGLPAARPCGESRCRSRCRRSSPACASRWSR